MIANTKMRQLGLRNDRSDEEFSMANNRSNDEGGLGRLRWLTCLILGLALIGCDADDQSANLVQLKFDELNATLRGQAMIAPRGIADTGDIEFHCDGTWSSTGGFAGLAGTFTVHEDHYCVEAHQTAACYRMFRNKSGALFQQAIPPPKGDAPGAVFHRPLGRVTLRRLRSC